MHDVIEDTAVTEEEVREVFGTRVAELVSAESENKRAELPAGDTWKIRKQETLEAEFGEKPAWQEYRGLVEETWGLIS